MPQATIEDLKKVVAVKGLPDDQITWIYDHSESLEYQDGDLVMKTGEPQEYMWMLYQGKCEFYMDVDGRLVHYFTFENDHVTGGVGGILPYSRLKVSPGNNYAVGDVKVFRIHKNLFHEMETVSPEFVQRLVGYMTERARAFATHKMQLEKVTALGQLAAGVAHELNNPAAAISRIGDELSNRLMENYSLTQNLLANKISPQVIQEINSMVDDKMHQPLLSLSAIDKIDLEDQLSDWFEQNEIKDFREKSEVFCEASFTVKDLDLIKQILQQNELCHILNWLENLLVSQKILKDLTEASSHISTLVSAIKTHVHMDRTNEKQPTLVHRDLETALTLLGYKLRDKNIKVTKKYCSTMKEVKAYIGELNQVWTNIIDNAIFAMPRGGELNLITECDEREVTVHIIDNGAGIPKEIQSRIFDPFFTTKKVGEGTGIGLNLAMTIMKRHDADIKVDSIPGRTEFIITIPFDQKSTVPR